MNQRERYASDPEYRAITLAKNKEYRQRKGREYLNSKRKYYEENRTAILAQKKNYAQAKDFPPGWASSLKRLYNISGEQYIEMHRKQNSLCAICKLPESAKTKYRTKLLGVDHNRSTGQIRKLLCLKHNTMLGLSNESILILWRAIMYLLKHRVISAIRGIN